MADRGMGTHPSAALSAAKISPPPPYPLCRSAAAAQGYASPRCARPCPSSSDPHAETPNQGEGLLRPGGVQQQIHGKDGSNA